MYYLYEHQVGHHSLALGFPSIDSCNAICLQTKTGLFGIHVFGCDSFGHISQSMEKESSAFASFVNGHPNGNDFIHLYGVCFHGKRGLQNAGKKPHAEELQVYARAINYKGPISMFDLSSVQNWPKGTGTATSDSAYVEFRRIFDKVTIMYKPWNQCVHPPEIKASSVSDGVNYRSTNQKGEIVNKFWFDKALTSLNTNGTGFVVAPEALRSTFKHKK